MYKAASRQERQNKDFFYPQETMGTTIMAIKYDGGVIACADSSTTFTIQEHPQEESTQ
jgi:20S proteasome alpha/beta subunit